MSSSPPIPIISLHGGGDLGEQILSAVVSTGFFYLTDHGIPQSAIDSLFSHSSSFFLSEPESNRLQCVDRANNTGYTPMKQESLDPTSSSDGDLKESFYLACLARAHGGSAQAEEKYKPPSQRLPPTLEAHREELAGFTESCKSVCDEILAGFARAIDLPQEYFTGAHHVQHDRLRLIHYPPHPVSSAHTTTSIRAGSHSDYGSCTLLFQRSVGGLQVLTSSSPETWTDIPPQEGCIVVNVGDAMEFWSAGLFRSTQHRVVLPRSEGESGSRFSVAYFCQPDEDAMLVPIGMKEEVKEKWKGEAMGEEEFRRRCKAKGVADVKELTGGQHLRARLGATYKT